jgi:hypothetical protein
MNIQNLKSVFLFIESKNRKRTDVIQNPEIHDSSSMMVDGSSKSVTMHFTFEATDAFLFDERGNKIFELRDFSRGKRRVRDSIRGENFVQF